MGTVQQRQVEGEVAPLDAAQGGLISLDLVVVVVVVVDIIIGVESATDLALVAGDDPNPRLGGVAVQAALRHVPQTVRDALEELGGVGLVVHLVLAVLLIIVPTLVVVVSGRISIRLNGPVVAVLEATRYGAIAEGAVVDVVIIGTRCAVFGLLIRLPRMAPSGPCWGSNHLGQIKQLRK